MMYSNVLQILFLCFVSVTALHQYDYCQLENGHTGQCIHILDCPSAQEALKKRITPRICGFEGLYTIVCCNVSLEIQPTPSIIQNYPTINHSPAQTRLKKPSPIELPSTSTQSESTTQQQEASWVPTTGSTETVIATDIPTSRSEELSEKKCQEYTNFEIPTTRSPIIKTFHSFVVGGVRARPKEFPHMAALGYGENRQFEWQCGGSLISEQFALTAAHCLFSRNLGDVKAVRLGDLNIYSTSPSTSRQEFNITHVYPHPNYTANSHYNDIALLKLDRPVVFSEFVRPACLQRNFDVNEQLTTTGWGAEEFGGSMQTFLQKADLYSLSVDNCNATYAPQRMLDKGFDEATQICGGNLMKRVDTCQGDSGGPLQSREIGSRVSYRIAGITSFGKNCGLVPGIYTRVSAYIPWIESIVWKE